MLHLRNLHNLRLLVLHIKAKEIRWRKYELKIKNLLILNKLIFQVLINELKFVPPQSLIKHLFIWNIIIQISAIKSSHS